MNWLSNKLGLTEETILLTLVATSTGLALLIVACKAIGYYYMSH
jgi:hypothetical protein